MLTYEHVMTAFPHYSHDRAEVFLESATKINLTLHELWLICSENNKLVLDDGRVLSLTGDSYGRWGYIIHSETGDFQELSGGYFRAWEAARSAYKLIAAGVYKLKPTQDFGWAGTTPP